jgi:5-methylcytosine-specific restriction endonuclease McrA
MAGKRLDAKSAAFRDAVEAIVREYSDGDTEEYFRRWRQLHNWGMDRAHGDVNKKTKLKALLMKKTEGKCQECGKKCQGSELDMHRIDPQYAFNKGANFGYFEENIVLLCRPCHGLR